jgi:hypothetical protein
MTYTQDPTMTVPPGPLHGLSTPAARPGFTVPPLGFCPIGQTGEKVEATLPKRARLQTAYQTFFPIGPSKSRCA